MRKRNLIVLSLLILILLQNSAVFSLVAHGKALLTKEEESILLLPNEKEYTISTVNNKKAVRVQENQAVEFRFASLVDAKYSVEVTYSQVEESTKEIVGQIKLDNVVPSSDFEEILFETAWKDSVADGAYKKDIHGNEICPNQIPYYISLSKFVTDTGNFYSDPVAVNITKGEHTLRLELTNGELNLHSVRLKTVTKMSNYQEVSAGYEKAGYTKATKALTVEAEVNAIKSNQTLIPLNDRTSPYVTPYDANKIIYNTIGGTRYKMPGSWIEWEITVPETGLYQLGFRYKMDGSNGYSSRILYIDGAVPFAEAKNIKFYADTKFKTYIVSNDNKEAYQFYFEKGKHNFRLETGLGDFGDILSEIQKETQKLNDIYLGIVVVTGPSPDLYRDYGFKALIPDVIQKMKESSERLKSIEKKIVSLNDKSATPVAIKRLYNVLDSMYGNTEEISKRLKDFQTNISSLATYLTSASEQPLTLDNIQIIGTGTKENHIKENFFKYLFHHFSQFISSYYIDYESYGDMGDSSDKSITVWTGSSAATAIGTGTGSDQAQIIKRIINDEFSPKTGISVNLQLVAMGALLPATLAGKGPDVALSQSQAEPVNYALRKAVVSLNEFDGIDEIKQEFLSSALVPFTLNGKLYALPETQTFPMLFYRKDILQKLSIKETDLQTFDSVFEVVLPQIQKNYLTFGVASVIGNYAMFLYQNGGEFYSDDNKKSAFHTKAAIDAFTQFSEIYTDYKQPLTFDFINRFRSGEMPVAISDFTAYNQLTVFAPEIKGLWSMIPVPGTRNEAGEINRSAASSVSGAVIMAKAKDKLSSFQFLKWWTGSKTQTIYASELETLLGSSARYPTANIKTMETISWNKEIRTALKEQQKYVIAIPEIAGGYFTPRNFDFAFRDVVYEGKNIREALNQAYIDINREITTKRKEFNLDE